MNFEQDIAQERLAVAKGIGLVKKGKVLVGRCPFQQHDDLTAFIIDPKANRWTCKAGCGEGGVVDFVAKSEGVSITHAEALLKADFDPDVSTGANAPKKSTTVKLAAVIEPDEADDVVLRQVLDFYRRTLLESPKALAWLHGRKLRDPDLIEHFKLGFCDRTLGYRIPDRNRHAGAALRGQLQRIGILRESGHEAFRGSVVVPITDLSGRVVQVYGHKIGTRLRKGTPTVTWLHDDHSVGVVNPSGFVQGQRMILAASFLNALTWWSAGFRNVTCTMDTTALPADVKALLVDKQIRSVCLAFRRDRDIEALQAELRGVGIEVSEVVFPAGLDAGDIARQADDPHDALGALLRASNWVSAGATPPVLRTTTSAALGASGKLVPEPDDHQIVIDFGERRWRIRGLEQNTSHSSLRVNVLVSNGDAAAFHVDVIELYSARQRRAFLKAASDDLGVEERVLKADLGRVLLKLEDVQDERIRAALEPEQKAVEIEEADRRAALRWLKQPDLLDRILADFEVLGVVGEETNKRVAYLAAISRKLPNPLAVVIQSSPAAGKSSLMDAVLRLVPDEDKLVYSAMTGRSLYYVGEHDLNHKVLAIAEEEGAAQASYALKLLQSEGHLTIASTGKESKTGRLSTQTYEVSGPVALLMTTTALDLDEELLSRCLVLTVDEGREQTRAIHRAQRHRATLDGLVAGHEAEQVVRLHHNAQRLLRPLHVVILPDLGVRFADHALRARRDHGKLLALVQAVALLRQYRKDIKEADRGGVRVKYIEADPDDVEVACKLLREVMGRSLTELPPGTRRLLGLIWEHVRAQADRQGLDPADVRFTRRELREALVVGNTQLKCHLRRLVDFEVVIVHRGGQPGRRVAYELVYTGEADEPTTTIGRGLEPDRSGGGRGVVGPRSGGGRGAGSGPKSTARKQKSATDRDDAPERSIGASEEPGRRSRTGGSSDAPAG